MWTRGAGRPRPPPHWKRSDVDEGLTGGGGQGLPQDRADAGTTVGPGSAPLMLLLGPQVLPHVLHVCEPGVRCADPTAHPQLAPTLQILPLVRLLPVRLRWGGGGGVCTVHLPGQLLRGPGCPSWKPPARLVRTACLCLSPGTPTVGSPCVHVGLRLLGLVFPGCQVLGFVPSGVQRALGSRVGSTQLKSQGFDRCRQAVPALRANSGWRHPCRFLGVTKRKVFTKGPVLFLRQRLRC